MSAISPVAAGDCSTEVCLTCADQALPVRVVRLVGDGLAVVDTGSTQEEISVALVSAEAGDTVLVHAKEAIAVLGGEPDGVNRLGDGH